MECRYFRDDENFPMYRKPPSFSRLRCCDCLPFVARSLVGLYGLLLVWVALAHGQQNGTAPQKINPYTGKAEVIAEGEALYKKFNCYACHGMKGGGGMGPNLTDETWQTGDGSDLTLLAQIRDGKGTMPPFKSMLSDDQAWKIISFVRSLYKGRPESVKW